MTEDRRPTPAFGEYAPEGWEWKPEEAATEAEGAESSPRQGSGRVPGVPHNLGAGSRSGASAQAPQQAPAAATPPASGQQPPSSSNPGGPAPFRATAQQPTPRRGDKVITIVLLVVGALGALNMAGSLLQLPGTMSMMAEALGVNDFSAPSGLATVGTVGAIAVIAVYALNLIYSIQRLRAGKLAFWVPLVAAVIAFIVTMSFTMYGLYQSPELVNSMTDPNAISKILEFASTGVTTP